MAKAKTGKTTSRKPIPKDTEKNVLLKSRRRCCLCFWYDGIDSVQKGQVAHLDQDNTNFAEDNLAFLCIPHHDDYDSITRQSKGLTEKEVKHWRDDLYKEMEFRFQTIKRRSFELALTSFLWQGDPDKFKAQFRLTNTGEKSERSPVVSIRVPDNADGMTYYWSEKSQGYGGWAGGFGTCELRADLFEHEGRVAVMETKVVLMPGHPFDFQGLTFHLADHPPESIVSLEYRVDAEDMTPFVGKVTAIVPAEFRGRPPTVGKWP